MQVISNVGSSIDTILRMSAEKDKNTVGRLKWLLVWRLYIAT